MVREEGNKKHLQIMAINANLASLMRVIEEYQDKMPEGEYLVAMNALGALHREIPPPAAAGAAVVMAAAGPPRPYYGAANPFPLFAAAAPPRVILPPQMAEDRIEYAAWCRVTKDHPEHFGISAQEWIGYSQEDRNTLLREATEVVVNNLELRYRNPMPEVCPFMARHSVGPWGRSWECVCGYKGLCKNWQKHEQSERHQDWAKHRTVSRRRIESMKQTIRKDEEGVLCRFKPGSQLDLGGIRTFLTTQDRNEWTHPELYTEFHRSPIPTADGAGRWFVHPRELWGRVYVQW